MSKFDAMNKEALRAACKAAGVVYGKMNNTEMRAALEALESKSQPAPAAQAPKADPKPEAPVAPRVKVPGEVVEQKSLKIEKNRDEANGIRRPSAGSICRGIWDELDLVQKASGKVPSFEDVRTLMKAKSWSRNTAFTQYQRWKQFHGVMPRAATEEEDAE